MTRTGGASAATIKRPAEIERMRAAGTILVDILDVLRAEIRPGSAPATSTASPRR